MNRANGVDKKIKERCDDMIVKKGEESRAVSQMDALLRRLPEGHSSYKRVYDDFIKARRGVTGEKEVAFPLSFIKKENGYLLYNLRIPDQNGAFQIDALLLTHTYILLLEVKNWYGTIVFAENGQVIRVGDDNREEGFPNPVRQAKLQRHRLKQWLQTKNIPAIPVISLVIISNPRTIIKSLSPAHPIPECVIHNHNLFFNVQKLDRQFTKQKINSGQIKNCAKALLKAHRPLKGDILAKYHVSKASLMTGVYCPKCAKGRMVRRLQKWYCHVCDAFSVDAHLEALHDYKILIHDFISNAEVRRFLHIDSPYVAKHLLQKAGFRKRGKTSATMYQLE